jgi:hypothetical protein
MTLRMLHARAGRTAEAVESLRARCGDRHADSAAHAAAILFQVRQLHALVHRQDLPEGFDIVGTLCAGFDGLQGNIIRLLVAVGIDRNDVAMLIPLLLNDLDDAVQGAKPASPGAQPGAPA